jgi:hypothetical protein
VVARTEGPVKYVDYTDTRSLRAAQFDPAIDIDQIVDVDIVWGERRLREAAGGEVDYVVASHVIEHVPDLIGWLHELREVLKPGGVLGLAVPDRRFTFDVLRRETDLAEVVEAYLTQSRRPTIRQVFDAASASAEVDVGAAWRGEPAADPEAPLKGAPGALRLARSLKVNPRYLDAHCWVFTPASFLDLAAALGRLELFPFAVEDFFPTETGAIEFQLRLRALAAGEAGAEDSIGRARETLAGADRPEAPPTPFDRELESLRAERDALLASTSWRVTAPLRALSRLLRGSG